MKNLALFVILALLTIAALIAWNMVGKRIQTPSQKLAVVSPTAKPSPTGTIGGALRNLIGGGNPSGTPVVKTSPYPTVPVSVTHAVTTKGGIGIVQPTTMPVYTNTANHAVVAYTDQGFSPSNVTIQHGSTVTFVNNSSQSMRVVSSGLSGLEMNSGVSKNGMYQYRFDTIGTWGYSNNGGSTGTVIVN